MKPYRFSAIIDKLTKSIEDTVTGLSHPTKVLPVTAADLKKVTKRAGWRFNWKAEAKKDDGRIIYKLIIRDQPDIIQCLISCRKDGGYFFLPLIETAPHNLGRRKRYQGAPANMVAFACKISMEAGFGGFISFTPKTMLIKHYNNIFGAIMINKMRMAIFPESAKKLVDLYYHDDSEND